MRNVATAAAGYQDLGTQLLCAVQKHDVLVRMRAPGPDSCHEPSCTGPYNDDVGMWVIPRHLRLPFAYALTQTNQNHDRSRDHGKRQGYQQKGDDKLLDG